MLLGTHITGARKGFPGQTLESGIEGSVPVGQTDGDKGRECRLADTKAHTPKLQAIWPPETCIDREHLKRGLTKRSSVPRAPIPLNSTKTALTQMARGGGGRQNRHSY